MSAYKFKNYTMVNGNRSVVVFKNIEAPKENAYVVYWTNAVYHKESSEIEVVEAQKEKFCRRFTNRVWIFKDACPKTGLPKGGKMYEMMKNPHDQCKFIIKGVPVSVDPTIAGMRWEKVKFDKNVLHVYIPNLYPGDDIYIGPPCGCVGVNPCDGVKCDDCESDENKKCECEKKVDGCGCEKKCVCTP